MEGWKINKKQRQCSRRRQSAIIRSTGGVPLAAEPTTLERKQLVPLLPLIESLVGVNWPVGFRFVPDWPIGVWRAASAGRGPAPFRLTFLLFYSTAMDQC